MESAERENYVYHAKLAEQAERYDDMVAAITNVVTKGGGLNAEERNLLSVAYKNVIGARRSAWRTISTEEQRLKDKNETRKEALAKQYLTEIELELSKTCKEILEVLDKFLIKDAGADDEKVFYLKMKGDYHRYLAEFSTGNDRSKDSKLSEEAYNKAKLAANELDATHPIRLGLALNFSVFYYEIKNDPDSACRLAKETFDNAITCLDSVPEESYKDSTLILQLLRDNLTLWTSENEEGKLEDVEDQQQQDS